MKSWRWWQISLARYVVSRNFVFVSSEHINWETILQPPVFIWENCIEQPVNAISFISCCEVQRSWGFHHHEWKDNASIFPRAATGIRTCDSSDVYLYLWSLADLIMFGISLKVLGSILKLCRPCWLSNFRSCLFVRSFDLDLDLCK